MTDSVFRAYKNLGELVIDAVLLPAWSPDGKSLGFLTGPADRREGWRVDLETGKKAALFDIVRLRAAIKQATGMTPPGEGVPFAQFGFAGVNTIAFAVDADQVTLDLDSYEARKVPPPSAIDTYMGLSEQARRQPRPFKRSMPLVDQIDAYEVTSPDGEWLLSIQNRNIALRSTCDGRPVVITSDGTPEVEWTIDWLNPLLAMLGMAAPVTNWSPQSDKIAVYKVDNRGVAQVPQPHYLKRYDEVVLRYAAKAGGRLETYTLYVIDVARQAPVEIQLGDTRDTYPVFAGWLPDGSGLVIFQMSRDCRRVDVHLADPASGRTRHLFTEEGKTFVRIHHDIYYGRKTGLTLTPDGQSLLWLSERDGFRHIYRYDLQGKLLGQITSGPWPVDAVTQVIGDQVYFTAHSDPERPYDLHLCRAPLAGGETKQLTAAPGRHTVMIAPNGKVFLDTHSAPEQPPVTELRTLGGACLNEAVSCADISPLKAVGFTPPEEFCVKAADGTTDLWGVMFKPHDFDPAKKYPVIEYIYGGPQIAVVNHAFTTGDPFSGAAARLAQLGCIAVILDARGTPERSKAFHDTVYLDWAGALVADHAAAIRQLAERYPFIDGSRVGITGHSWGGYSSARCLLEAPDVYKAAVSSAPGYDPYASVLYECYLGLPQQNPGAYRAANVIPLAPKLERALMIACGTSDHSTWTDAMKLSEALIRAGKEHDFVVLPGQPHGWDSVHDEYYQRKLVAFFRRHLDF